MAGGREKGRGGERKRLIVGIRGGASHCIGMRPLACTAGQGRKEGVGAPGSALFAWFPGMANNTSKHSPLCNVGPLLRRSASETIPIRPEANMEGGVISDVVCCKNS